MKKKNFKKHGYVSYIDAVSSIDHDLLAVAELCIGADEKINDSILTLNWLGEFIQRHVYQHQILRHKHFDERLDYPAKNHLGIEREKLTIKPLKAKVKKRGKK